MALPPVLQRIIPPRSQQSSNQQQPSQPAYQQPSSSNPLGLPQAALPQTTIPINQPSIPAPQSRGRGGSSGGGSSLPQSSIATPTPSASVLTGTPAQREQQIAAYQGRTIQSQFEAQPKSVSAAMTPGGAILAPTVGGRPSVYSTVKGTAKAVVAGGPNYFHNVLAPTENLIFGYEDTAQPLFIQGKSKQSSNKIFNILFPGTPTSMTPGAFRVSRERQAGIPNELIGTPDVVKTSVITESTASEFNKDLMGAQVIGSAQNGGVIFQTPSGRTGTAVPVYQSVPGGTTQFPEVTYKLSPESQEVFQSDLNKQIQSNLGPLQEKITTANVEPILNINKQNRAIFEGGVASAGLVLAPELIPESSVGLIAKGIAFGIAGETSLAQGAKSAYSAFSPGPKSLSERGLSLVEAGAEIGTGYLLAKEGFGSLEAPVDLSVTKLNPSNLIQAGRIKAREAELSQLKFNLKGVEVEKRGAQSLYDINLERVTPGGFAKESINFRLSSFSPEAKDILAPTESGQLILIEKGEPKSFGAITEGNYLKRISGYDVGGTYETPLSFKGQTITNILSSNSRLIGSSKYGKVGFEFKEGTPGVGTGFIDILQTGERRPFAFAGVAQPSKEGIDVLGGKLSRVGYESAFRSSEVSGVSGNLKAKVNLDYLGRIKTLPAEEERVGTFIVGGSGRKSSPAFLKQLYKQEQAAVIPIPGIASEVQKAAPPLFKPAESSLKFTSAYAGQGLYERTNELQASSPKLEQQTLSGNLRRTFQGTTLSFGTPYPSERPYPPIQLPRSNLRLSLSQPQPEIQVPRLSTPALLVTPQVPSFPTPKAPYPTSTFTPGFFAPPPLPSFKEDYAYRPSRSLGLKYGYQPSITAGLLGIKASKIPKQLGYFGGYSGLKISPLIVGGRKNKRKKK